MKRTLQITVILLMVSLAGLSSAAEYLVGPGDVLDITVYDNDDLKTRVRVGNDGTIVMSLLGQVEVSKLSVTQIGDKITALLADGYLVKPQVNVFIEEFRSKKVVVLGRVRAPGLVELSGPISFLELVSKAGGLENDAGDTATIKRKENGADKIILIDLVSLVEGGDITQNIQILDGDTVVISKSGTCYVTGEVNEPGSYPCGDGSTVLQLIALANGFNGKASKSSVRIVRFVNNEKTILKDVDLDDTEVFDNDVIVVPESFF
jgi:polysaccharide export outer membrane protein